jgi:hypothetical protein
MKTFGLLGLMAVLTICYLQYFRSQDLATANSAEESKPIAVANARGVMEEPKPGAPAHSVYKADLDRAHEAARQIQLSHATASSF